MTRQEYLALIEDIGGPGIYASASLYAWYVDMAREDGREPVSRRKFGMTLTELGLKSRTRRLAGVPTRSWLVTRGSLKRAAETVTRECQADGQAEMSPRPVSWRT